MINGMHAVVFSSEAEKVRDFFADVIGLSGVDAAEAGSSSPCHPLSWRFTPPTGKAATSST